MNDSHLRRRLRRLCDEAIAETAIGCPVITVGDIQALLDDPEGEGSERFDYAVDWLLNAVDPDFSEQFFDYYDGLLTKKELRDESVSRKTRLRRRVKAEAEGRLR